MDGTNPSPEPAEQVAQEIAAAGGEAVACFASVADAQVMDVPTMLSD
jgi:hypothetical protein